MTETPKDQGKKFSIREYLQSTFESENLSIQNANREFDEAIQRYERQAKEASNPIDRRLNWLASLIYRVHDAELTRHIYTLALLNIVGQAIEAQKGDLTQTQQEKMVGLRENAEKAKEDIDRHLAKRLTELCASKGHEAMYGTGKQT
jgi:hypothetical protein